MELGWDRAGCEECCSHSLPMVTYGLSWPWLNHGTEHTQFCQRCCFPHPQGCGSQWFGILLSYHRDFDCLGKWFYLLKKSLFVLLTRCDSSALLLHFSSVLMPVGLWLVASFFSQCCWWDRWAELLPSDARKAWLMFQKHVAFFMWMCVLFPPLLQDLWTVLPFPQTGCCTLWRGAVFGLMSHSFALAVVCVMQHSCQNGDIQPWKQEDGCGRLPIALCSVKCRQGSCGTEHGTGMAALCSSSVLGWTITISLPAPFADCALCWEKPKPGVYLRLFCLDIPLGCGHDRISPSHGWPSVALLMSWCDEKCRKRLLKTFQLHNFSPPSSDG